MMVHINDRPKKKNSKKKPFDKMLLFLITSMPADICLFSKQEEEKMAKYEWARFKDHK